MAAEKPIIALIPGAWLPGSTYAAVTAYLEEAGHETKLATLASFDPASPAAITIERDAEMIRSDLLVPLIEDRGLDVVLLMHSYGAQPGSAAAIGLGKHERSQAGLKGGVTGFVSLCGFVLTEGASLADGQGGSLPDWVLQDTPSDGLSMPKNPESNVLHGMPNDLASQIAAEIRPHATAPFKQAQPGNSWASPAFENCRGFVMCKEDEAVPIGGQQAMVQYCGCGWTTTETEGGHCAYIDRPSVVGKAIVELIAGFNPPT